MKLPGLIDLPRVVEAQPEYPRGTEFRYIRRGRRLILQAGIKKTCGLVSARTWRDVPLAKQAQLEHLRMSLVERDTFEAAVEAKKAAALARPKITLKQIEDALGPTLVRK